VFESRLMESALQRIGVPHTLLIFSGECHDFENPWHVKIAVRKELKWIEKYAKENRQ